MSLPAPDALHAWFRDWINEQHAECEAGIDRYIHSCAISASTSMCNGTNDPEYG